MTTKLLILSLAVFTFGGCSTAPIKLREPAATGGEEFAKPIPLAEDEYVITLVGTNDIHGNFDTTQFDSSGEGEDDGSGANAKLLGGFQWFAGYVNAIRQASAKQYGKKGIVLVLDAGDAAQGTLLSNQSEGEFAARMMNHIGYTAAVPGNHAFDFGPVDPAIDQCLFGKPSCDPLQALREKFAEKVKFPIVAANVTQKSTGRNLPYLRRFTLVQFQGRNIAVIGLENMGTPSTTYSENVKGLKFTNGVQEITEIVQQNFSAGLVDVFVLVAHNGDKPNEAELSKFLECGQGPCLGKRADGQPMVDAAIAGHQHVTNDLIAGGVPFIQSKWAGRNFGIIQLVVKKDAANGRLVVQRERTRKQASIPIVAEDGDFMGEPVRASADVLKDLEAKKKEIQSLADTEIGKTLTEFSGDGKRTSDSEIGNLIADMMRKAAGTRAAIIGSGDVRVGISEAKDPLRYNDLFNVIPKNLQLVAVREMPVKLLADNVKKSIVSCGRRGALQFSGMQVYFKRSCKNPVNGEDPKAVLTKIVAGGRQIFPTSDAKATISVATTDFIMTGGAGYTAFREFTEKNASDSSVMTVVGPMRDLIAKEIKMASPLSNTDFKPGRYVNALEPKKPKADESKPQEPKPEGTKAKKKPAKKPRPT